MGGTPISITPSNPLAKIQLSFTTRLNSGGLEVLVPKVGRLLPEETKILLNWELSWPQANKGVSVLAGVIILITKGNWTATP